MGGNEELCFAVFFSETNDMHQTWMKHVQILYENGVITSQGNEFLQADWRVSAVYSQEGSHTTLYTNTDNEWVIYHGAPIGVENKPLSESLWANCCKRSFLGTSPKI